MKKLKLKHVHILIIIVGILFITLSSIHANLWFDESYSVAISNNHSFQEIWGITGHDVHPPFYYWMLKIVSMIFGNNIICYRLLSVLAIAILGILGYTHIRKDFGEKVGAIFSLLVFTLPINIVYAGEVRMYGWGMLFVTIMGIYAYRIFSGKATAKNWIIFAIFSLISAYTHYYGLMAAGITNVILFIWVLVKAIKEKQFTKNLKAFIIQAVIQVALYIPWLVFLTLQLSQVSRGFWIGFTFPDSLVEMFLFQFTGNLGDDQYINSWVAGIYGIIFTAYLLWLVVKNIRSKDKTDLKPAKWSFIIYICVILGAGVVSIVMKPIIYARYFLIVTGLLIFTFSYLMAKVGNKKANICIIILTIVLATYSNINLAFLHYDKSNQAPFEYLKDNIQEGDILIYGNEGSGFVVSANFPEYKQYFYDAAGWHVDEAYRAYGPNMETKYDLEFLKDYQGRIWFINAGTHTIYEQANELYPNMELIKQARFDVKYKGYIYTFSLVDKKW